MVRNKISENIFIHFNNLCKYIIYLTCFGYILAVDLFHYYISVSILKRKCRIKLFTFDILHAWVIFEKKHWYFLGMLSSEIILEKKKPLKISHNSVSLFLPFSIRLTFSRPFCEKRYYCFPEGFAICNFFMSGLL